MQNVVHLVETREPIVLFNHRFGSLLESKKRVVETRVATPFSSWISFYERPCSKATTIEPSLFRENGKLFPFPFECARFFSESIRICRIVLQISLFPDSSVSLSLIRAKIEDNTFKMYPRPSISHYERVKTRSSLFVLRTTLCSPLRFLWIGTKRLVLLSVPYFLLKKDSQSAESARRKAGPEDDAAGYHRSYLIARAERRTSFEIALHETTSLRYRGPLANDTVLRETPLPSYRQASHGNPWKSWTKNNSTSIRLRELKPTG